MKSNLSAWLKSGAFLAFALACGSTRADTIDFSGYADGTAVTATNPSNGILDITATTSVFGLDYQETHEAKIKGGVLEALPGYTPDGGIYESDLTATFLTPVTDVSFKFANWRSAVFFYSGVDADGNTFSRFSVLDGVIEDSSRDWWTTFTLDIPQGGNITECAITNRDPSPTDAAFWVNSINYTPVPDGGSVLAILTVTLSGLFMLRSANSRRK